MTVKQGSDRGGAFNNVPACRSKKQRHCVVAYSVFNEPPPADPAFGTPTGALVETVVGPGRTDLEVLCTNPAALGGGQAPLRTLVPTSRFPGTIGLGVRVTFGNDPPTAPTPWVQPQDHYTGGCVNSNGANVLMISPGRLRAEAGPGARSRLGPAPGRRQHRAGRPGGPGPLPVAGLPEGEGGAEALSDRRAGAGGDGDGRPQRSARVSRKLRSGWVLRTRTGA